MSYEAFTRIAATFEPALQSDDHSPFVSLPEDYASERLLTAAQFVESKGGWRQYPGDAGFADIGYVELYGLWRVAHGAERHYHLVVGDDREQSGALSTVLTEDRLRERPFSIIVPQAHRDQDLKVPVPWSQALPRLGNTDLYRITLRKEGLALEQRSAGGAIIALASSAIMGINK